MRSQKRVSGNQPLGKTRIAEYGSSMKMQETPVINHFNYFIYHYRIVVEVFIV